MVAKLSSYLLCLFSLFLNNNNMTAHAWMMPLRSLSSTHRPSLQTCSSSSSLLRLASPTDNEQPPSSTSGGASSGSNRVTMSDNQLVEAVGTAQAGGSTNTNDDDTTNNGRSPQEPLRQQQQQQRPTELSGQDMMRVLGTSPRRLFLGFLSASGIALGGNFLGVTSNLLTTIPEDVVEATGVDTYFPRGDYKRCRGTGYTFVFPKEWVGDTFVELAKAQRMTQSLDYKMSRSRQQQQLPDAAFGPPGRLNQRGVSEQGDTNVSVLVSTLRPGFSLSGTLGTPTTAAETLLKVSLAPEGSGRVATLLYATEDVTRNVYQFAYTVDRGVERGLPPLKAISVIGARNADLMTLTVVAPLKEWENPEYASKLEKIANSFHVI